MAVWLYVLFGLLSLIYVRLKWLKGRQERLLLKVPGFNYNFLWGDAARFLVPREDLSGVIDKIVEEFRHAPIARIWLGFSPKVLILKASAAEAVLSSNRWLDKGPDYELLNSWLGTGLLTGTGSKWHSRRKLITPTFHFRILEDFLLVMNEQSNVLVRDVLSKKQDGQVFDIYPYLCKCTLDVICETSMGAKLHSQLDENANYVASVNGVGEIVLARSFNVILHPDWIYNMTPMSRNEKIYLKTLHAFTKKVIEERKRERLKAKSEEATEKNDEEVVGIKKRLAFLDLLLESAELNKIDDAGIQEEVDTFMFEGHDTTASGLAWIVYNLGRFQHHQKAVKEELDEVLGESNRGETITSDQLSKLKFLERFVKESMRLFPPVPFYERVMPEDGNIAGYTVPKGTVLAMVARSIHTDPQHWADPLTFDPDRFLPENSANRHPYSYVPFSAGPRNCIGQKFAMMELKIVTAKMVQEFEIESMEKLEDIKVYSELVLRPVKGIQIKLTKRH